MIRKSEADAAASQNSLGATVHSFTLPAGLYYFSVAAGTPLNTGGTGQLPLPAVQVSVAPGVKPEQIEFILGPQMEGFWFYEPGNAMVARVNGLGATVVLTSIRGSSDAELKVNIERLDNRSAAATNNLNPAVNAAAEPYTAVAEPRKDLRLQIAAHVRGRGDMKFVDAPWAAKMGKGAWIEAFSVAPLEQLTAQDLEYKGLTASGFETPWLSNEAICGTRGMGIPLIGFAVRLKAGEQTRPYDCEYSGYFASGITAGPFRNGTPCRSTVGNDPVEGIQIRIVKRQVDGANDADSLAATKRTTPLGPKFSKFRGEGAAQEAKKRAAVQTGIPVSSTVKAGRTPVSPKSDKRTTVAKQRTPAPKKKSASEVLRTKPKQSAEVTATQDVLAVGPARSADVKAKRRRFF